MKKRVVYYYDPQIGTFHYAHGHPMRPLRVSMTHSLITNYGLHRHMDILRPEQATYNDLTNFHSREYVNFLQSVCKENQSEMASDFQKFNVGEDSPVFQGIYDYCRISAGGSIAAAEMLNAGRYDIAINWVGGLHHAKRAEASGFCYINDIVLGILELLKYHERVLYIDIDVHHGDGVEEAFYTTDRVMTVSFHKYGDYFPGTGSLEDIGLLDGKHYAVNVPLKDGITDENYHRVFKPVISTVFKFFNPGAVVLQCGADSLSGDRLGCFNLSHIGHTGCVKLVKEFNVPLMLLGGGGYTIKNVSKVWTYATSVALGVEIPDELPFNEFYPHYAPDYKICVHPGQMKDVNSSESLDHILEVVTESLRHVPYAPSVQMVPVHPPIIDVEDNEESLWYKYSEMNGLKCEK